MPKKSDDSSGEVAKGKLLGERCTFKACRKFKPRDYPVRFAMAGELLRGETLLTFVCFIRGKSDGLSLVCEIGELEPGCWVHRSQRSPM